jgi:hypothetical protein
VGAKRCGDTRVTGELLVRLKNFFKPSGDFCLPHMTRLRQFSTWLAEWPLNPKQL